MPQGISLIVGLGNPGAEYADTRHNAGFRFLDQLAGHTGCSLRLESRFSGKAGKAIIGDREVWLLAPQTFMNRSGESVVKLSQYYKIPVESILVAHDELDLPVGTARLKQGGGAAGHEARIHLDEVIRGNLQQAMTSLHAYSKDGYNLPAHGHKKIPKQEQ